MTAKSGLVAAAAILTCAGSAWAQTDEEPWIPTPPPPVVQPVTPPPPAPAATPKAPPQAGAAEPEPVVEMCVAPCEEPDGKKKEKRVADSFGGVGVRVGATHNDTNAIGVAFAGRAAENADIGITNSRGSIFWVLGGGGAGFEGAFGGSAAGGIRASFDKNQGAVFRLAIDGYILGNDLLYASMFEFPQGQIAYQFLQRNTLFEIGGKSGAVLTGRFRDPTTEGVRKYPVSLEWGGYASLHFAPMILDASYTRIEDRNDAIATPIDVVEGNACGVAGPISLCVDARYQRGDIALPGGGDKLFTSLYGGMTAGIGWRGERPKKAPSTAAKLVKETF